MSPADDERDQIRAAKRERLLAAQSAGAPIHIESRTQFEEAVGEAGVVLVDFYADWCGPCKMLEPTVDALAEEGTTVLKVDVDDHGDIAQAYQVQGVPTLYLFVDGEPKQRMVGVQDKGTLSNLISQYA